MKYEEVDGDLISLALNGEFDVIAHGCNCFCRMKRGIAPLMATTFGCDKFIKESKSFEGDINKLGQIDYILYNIAPNRNMHVVNAYTQYLFDINSPQLDYEALTLCLRKINLLFKGDSIGLPRIGAGLAGGDWERIKTIIQQELKDCDVTVVIYNK